MGESAVVKMNEDGVMVLPIEIRELLNVEDERVYLRLNDIEVAKRLDKEDEEDTTDEDAAEFVERFEDAVKSGDPSEITVRKIRSNITHIENESLLEEAINLDDRKTAREQYESQLNNL